MATTLTLEELYRPVESELGVVRETVADLWTDALRLVQGPSTQRKQLGGKMLRPALCLLSAGAAGARDLERFVPLATAMEILHLAALVHDDIVDGADTRRGTRSLKAQWGNRAAVLGGDYLVARAVSIMGSYGSCDVLINAVNSVRTMAEGELADFGRGPSCFTQDTCLELAEQKTASLFAAACSTPIYLIDPKYRDPFQNFGMGFGVAFQIIDDVLDLYQDEEILGKPTCRDIVAGKRTLPILFLREALDEEGRRRLDGMKGATCSEADRAWICMMLETTGTREHSERLAREYVDKARTALDDIEQNAYRDAMLGLAEFVLVRSS